jgi:hypothetical protein
MKPYAAVQALFVWHPEKKRYGFAGSCFRLWSDNHFLAARHCVNGSAPEKVAVLNCLGEDDTKDELMKCVSISEHPTADLAVIEIKGTVPNLFQKFRFADRDYDLGTCVHCFGILNEWMVSPNQESAPGRVIAGILQRDFVWRYGPY